MRGIHIFEKPYYREIRPMRGRPMRGLPVVLILKSAKLLFHLGPANLLILTHSANLLLLLGSAILLFY